MRKIMFLLFFLAVFNVDGTQDANISFDSKGFDYCIAIDNLILHMLPEPVNIHRRD